jgi:hypothetical protein
MLSHIRSLTLLGCMFVASISHASYDPNIFHFNGPEFTNVNVTLSGDLKDGTKWVARTVIKDDLESLKKVYQDPQVMVNFGDGQVKTDQFVQGRVDLGVERSQLGQPHAGMVIETAEGHEFLGYLVAGAQGTPGVSEVARLICFKSQGNGIGGSAMKAVTQVWAPAVRHVGVQTENLLLQGKFSCFNNEPLKQLYVSSSPANIASWKTQVNAGFVAKPVEEDLQVIDFTACGVEDYVQLEASFSKMFDAANGDDALKVGTLYPMLDQAGFERTISMHPTYKRPKFQFVYDLAK